MLETCRVPENMPLYDILNEFQKGGSHMAAVVAVKQKKRKLSRRSNQEDRKGVKEYHVAESDIEKGDEKPHYVYRNGSSDPSSDTEYEQLRGEEEYMNHEDMEKPKPDIEHGDVIGIITMEDVMEELLQVPILFLYQEIEVLLLFSNIRHSMLLLNNHGCEFSRREGSAVSDASYVVSMMLGSKISTRPFSLCPLL